MSEQIKDGGPAFPVVEFRPLPNSIVGEVRRYANGKWVADDGEYDLAFISSSFAEAMGFPICLMFEHSHQRNIVTKWFDGSWRAREPRHPNGNPWHYVLREGETKWGGEWGHESHPNYIAGRSGMNKLSSEFRCANGKHISMDIGDQHVAAGLVRDRETGLVLTIPHGPCMYCGESSENAMLAAREVTP